jgi:hypothetical protein
VRGKRLTQYDRHLAYKVGQLVMSVSLTVGQSTVGQSTLKK